MKLISIISEKKNYFGWLTADHAKKASWKAFCYEKADKEEGAVRKVSNRSVKSKGATRKFKENYTGAKSSLHMH